MRSTRRPRSWANLQQARRRRSPHSPDRSRGRSGRSAGRDNRRTWSYRHFRYWELEDDAAKRWRLLATLFERVWQDGGTIVAVEAARGVPTLLPDSRRARASPREEERGKSGSDGIRTRDLRRDRAASRDGIVGDDWRSIALFMRPFGQLAPFLPTLLCCQGERRQLAQASVEVAGERTLDA